MLKRSTHVVADELWTIWGNEIKAHRCFSNRLKLADITPRHKKMERNLKENYRNVTILPTVSKVTDMLCASFRT